ncbi:MAG: SufB/SufD family protein [Planktomarina sp.]
MALLKAKADVTDAMLQHFTKSGGMGWLDRARDAALDRVGAMGLPVRRDEYWKYTNPKGFTDLDPRFDGGAPDTGVFGDVEAITLHFADGVLQGDLPDLDGGEITLLSTASAADIHWAGDIYGVLEAAGQTPVDRPLAALNTAIATEGVLLSVTGQIKTPIRLRYTTTGGQTNLHHVMKLAEGASVTLIEEGTLAARGTSVMEVIVAPGAIFDHVRAQPAFHNRQIATHIFGQVAASSVLRSFTLTADGALTRNEVVLDIIGDNATASVAGGACLCGSDTHHDDTVFITHDAVDCESRQVFKKVIRDGATGVFQGKILVQPDAQKTDGYQISQSLLLDDDSNFLAKPELEIYADDVACSHGSTSGAIDDNALFYLRSRGVPKGKAEDLLTLSFLAEAAEEISDDSLRDAVLGYFEHILNSRHG